MSFSIDGWVEVTIFREDERDEHSWRGLIRLSPLIDTSDGVSEALFGLSKRCVTEGAGDALAGKRGVPAFPSAEVRTELEEIRMHEEKFGAGEYGGYTFATWAELKGRRTELAAQFSDSDWWVVFDMIERVERDYRFAEDRIRVITWFEW